MASLIFFHETIRDVYSFLKKPTLENQELSLSKKIAKVLVLFVLKLTLTIILSTIINSFFDKNSTTIENFKALYPPIMLAIIGGIIAPLIEETGFRLCLKFKPIYLSISLLILSYYVLTKLIYNVFIIDLNHHLISRIVIPISIGIISYLIVKKSQHLDLFWKNKFGYIFYFFTLIFAFSHIVNYEYSWKNFLFMPILTLPHFVGGLFYGYVRIKFGFLYGLLFHIMNNAPIAILMAIVKT